MSVLSYVQINKELLKPPPGTSDISYPFLFIKKQHLQSKITCATLGICIWRRAPQQHQY